MGWRFLLGCAALCACEGPPRLVVVHAGRLIDGTGGSVRERQRLVIRDGLIESVAPDTDAPPPAEAGVLDARALTVLPGLIDVHTHLFSAPACRLEVGGGLAQATRNLASLLHAGVTTAADLSAPAFLGIGLRRFVGTARHRGPRVLVAGPMLTAPRGYPFELVGDAGLRLGMLRFLDTPEAAVRTVRELAAAGVDLLKVALQEHAYAGTPTPMLDAQVLCALVEEAHRQALRVVAHAVTARAWELGLRCHIDAFAHGAIEPLSEEVLAEVARQKLPVAPTLFVWEAVPGVRRAALAEDLAYGRANTHRLMELGVPLALGTDSAMCFNLPGRPIEELVRMQEAGLPPLAVLAAGTSGSARFLGLDDALGTLAPGFRADLIAVAGRPDERLADITAVRAVLIDGVAQRLPEPSWLDTLLLAAEVVWAKLHL